MGKRIVVITQNENHMREMLGERFYYKRCENDECKVRVRTRRRTYRTCPRCGSRLVKTSERPEFTG